MMSPSQTLAHIDPSTESMVSVSPVVTVLLADGVTLTFRILDVLPRKQPAVFSESGVSH